MVSLNGAVSYERGVHGDSFGVDPPLWTYSMTSRGILVGHTNFHAVLGRNCGHDGEKKRIKMVFSWSNPLKLTYCCFNPMFHASIHRSLLDKVSRCLNLTGKNPGFAMCSRSDHGNKR